VVKEYNDLMAATRYGVMMLRYARALAVTGFNLMLIEFSNEGKAEGRILSKRLRWAANATRGLSCCD
jgi:hypothetical protein